MKVAKANQKVLRNFFSTIKGMDQYLKFVFITGVTKFAKTSVFSGMNNRNDITLQPIASDLLGYTEEEVKMNFKEYIDLAAKNLNLDSNKLLEEIKKYYNGYRFSELETKVFNPFSLQYFLDRKKFENFWLETGTPFFLIHLLKGQYEKFENFKNVELSRESVGSFEIDQLPIIPILFQAGYLTISEYNNKTNQFKLDFPNFEVQQAFDKYLIAALSNSDTYTVNSTISQLKDALENNDVENFCNSIRILLANIPYNLYIEHERYFHSLFHLIVNLLGFEAQSEILTNKGRIDLTIITKKRIYIFEFKLYNSSESALNQIIDKTYYEKFLNQNKPITLVGISFSYKVKHLKVEYVKSEINK